MSWHELQGRLANSLAPLAASPFTIGVSVANGTTVSVGGGALLTGAGVAAAGVAVLVAPVAV